MKVFLSASGTPVLSLIPETEQEKKTLAMLAVELEQAGVGSVPWYTLALDGMTPLSVAVTNHAWRKLGVPGA